MLGQVMTRMKLSLAGNPTNNASNPDAWSPFKVLLVGFIAYVAMEQFVSMLKLSYMNLDENTGTYTLSDDAPVLVVLMMALNHILRIAVVIYLLVLMFRTRRHIRRTYNIHGGECEDCCCAYWCGFCTVSQMARHTADYRTYQATCCTETGLGEHAPPTLDASIV